jgi:hypothetical protein
MRMKHYKSIEKLYITADSDSIITPGLLCREMLCEFLSLDTPIILASHTPAAARPFDVQVTSLRQLYPYPPIHLNVPGSTVAEFAKHFHSTCEKPAMQLTDRPDWLQLYRQVVATTDKGQQQHKQTRARPGAPCDRNSLCQCASTHSASVFSLLQMVVPACIRFALPRAFCSATARAS